MAVATKEPATQEKPIDAFTLPDLRALAMDSRSEYHKGPRAVQLQAQYAKLRAAEIAKAEAVPDSERPVKPPKDDAIDLIEFFQQTWKLTVSDVPVAHFAHPEFFSNIRKAIKTFDRIEVVDEKRRLWHELLVVHGIQGRNVRAEVLRTKTLDAAPEVRAYDLPVDTEIRYDEKTETFSGWALKPEEVRLVPPRQDEKQCADELRNHARFRGDNPTRYFP